MRKGLVYVGLSGGVDSSVAAHILKEEGFEVRGLFIKAWQPEFFPCTWVEDRLSAMRVAAHLDIPFETLDLEKEYKTSVVDEMIDGYKKGFTPNPDVLCNKTIKFDAFFNYARKNGADFIATGHYARVKSVIPNQGKKYQLLKGVDDSKDQSYFLWTLKEDQLAHTLFPIGEMQKEDVRSYAKRVGLPTWDKRDSQGLCFIGAVNVKDFLSRFLPIQRGDVINKKGDVIGEHQGVHFFTLGERHGFTINKSEGENAQQPLYVVGKDAEKNVLIVAPTIEVAKKTEMKLLEANFIGGFEDSDLNNLTCRVRHLGDFIPATFLKETDTLELKIPILFSEGQSAVLYVGERCLGGAIIGNPQNR